MRVWCRHQRDEPGSTSLWRRTQSWRGEGRLLRAEGRPAARLLLRSELRCGAAEPRARPAVGSRPAGPGVRGLRAALSPEPSALAGR